MNDELYEYDTCSFYKTLLAKHKKQLDNVQDQGGIICVPLHDVTEDSLLSIQFIQSHLFIPSQFFKNQYSSINSHLNEQFKLIIDENASAIVLIDNKSDKTEKKIKILSEQIGYTMSSKTYRIFVIDRPVKQFHDTSSSASLNHKNLSVSNVNYSRSSNNNSPSTSRSASPYTGFNDEQVTVEHVKSFGKSVEYLQKISISLCDQFYNDIRLFNKTYIILPKYFNECIDKMCQIYRTYALRFRKYLQTQQAIVKEEILSIAIENYLNGFLYAKLWSIILDIHKDEDQFVHFKIIQLRKLTKLSLENFLKLDRKYFIDYKQSIAEISRIDKLQSAYEKLYCMKTCNDLISTELLLYHKNRSNMNLLNEHDIKLTSDELLPLTCYILIKSDVNFCLSLIYYLENFHFTSSYPAFDSIQSSSINEFSFILSTFKAAVNLIQSYNSI